MERVMIFIDGSNFDYAKKELFQETGEPVPKIDYGKFARKLAGDNRILLKTHYYTAQSERADDPAAFDSHQRFLDSLRHKERFEVITGFLKKRPIPGVQFDPADKSTWVHVEKGTDVNLATDMLIKGYHNAYDTAILVSADSDFAKVIQDLKRIGKVIELAVTPLQQSQQLRMLADRVILIDQQFLKNCV